MSITERNSKLKEVFKYSDADMLLNKQEKISESQSATLKSYRQGRMIALIAFGVMFVLFALVFMGLGIWMLVNPGGDVRRLAILGAMGVISLVILASSANYFIRTRDILTGKVSQKQGAAKLYTRQYRDEYSSLGMGWFVKIDKKEFGLKNSEQYAALEEGADYRIFYIRGYPLDMLLTVEAV